MERQIVAFAMLAIPFLLMAHVVLSYSWRSQLLDRLDLFGDVLTDMREALEEMAYEALDEDRPDMIAMLGDAYAPESARNGETYIDGRGV